MKNKENRLVTTARKAQRPTFSAGNEVILFRSNIPSVVQGLALNLLMTKNQSIIAAAKATNSKVMFTSDLPHDLYLLELRQMLVHFAG